MPNYPDVTSAPIWKQSMLVLLALFPLVMLELLYLFPHLTAFNQVLVRFLGSVIIVCSLSWIMLPITLRALGWWLHARSVKIQFAGLFIILSLYLAEIYFFLLIS